MPLLLLLLLLFLSSLFGDGFCLECARLLLLLLFVIFTTLITVSVLRFFVFFSFLYFWVHPNERTTTQTQMHQYCKVASRVEKRTSSFYSRRLFVYLAVISMCLRSYNLYGYDCDCDCVFVCLYMLNWCVLYSIEPKCARTNENKKA